MISKFFIEHPIFANVIGLVTLILGGVFLYGLPVAQYPEIVPPTIQVSTRYPGAMDGRPARARLLARA